MSKISKKNWKNLKAAASAPAPALGNVSSAKAAEEALEGLAEWTGVADGPESPAPETAAPAPLKEDSARETPKRVRKAASAPKPAAPPVNRIELAGKDATETGAGFRLIVAGEPRGSYAFYTTAEVAFETAVGRRPVKGEFPDHPRLTLPSKVVNGARIKVASKGGFHIFYNGKFRDWRETLPEAEAYLESLKLEGAKKETETLAPLAPPKPAAAAPAEKGDLIAEAAKAELEAAKPPAPAEVQAPPEKPAKPAKKASGPAKITAVPPAPETSKPAPVPNPTELFRIKALAADAAAGIPGALAAFLAEVPEDLFRAEAERRGIAKPAKPSNGTANRGPVNRDAHVALTKQAWIKARELAAAKGGKPQDHMKEAWAGLVRD